MAHVPLEKMLDKAGGSVFRLIMLGSRRALEIADGAAKLIQVNVSKPTTIALEEIAAGKVYCKDRVKKEE